MSVDLRSSAGAVVERLHPHRVKRAVHRYGVRGIAAGLVGRMAFTDRQFWYELELGSDRPRVALADDFVVRRPGVDEAGLIERLPSIPAVEAERRLRAGAELWMAFSGEEPAFCCWVFRTEAPTPAAPSHVLRLPEGVVCLEDSVTGRDFRGRGLAPAVWSILADEEEGRGTRSIVTRIGEENVPSRRAILKAGFVEIALVVHTRRLAAERVGVRSLGGETARYLATILPR